MSIRTQLVVAFSFSLLVACNGSRRGGTDAGTDFGLPHVDGGGALDLGSHDGSTPVDLGSGHDMGTTGGDAGMCGAVVSAVPAGTIYCDTTTYDCLTTTTCTTTTCVDGCYAGDSHGDNCRLCVQQDNIACANASGCMTQWHDLDCCASANCPMGSPTTCVMTMCGTQQSAYNTCYSANGPGSASAPACGGDAAQCFGM